MPITRRRMLLIVTWALLSLGSVRAELVVASLNQVVGSIAAEVGGDAIRLISLANMGSDPHTYSPTPVQLQQARDATFLLVAGKGLESYLNDLRDNLLPSQELIEVGLQIPSMKIQSGTEIFACCPAHSQGSIDPHWWHSPRNASRAARNLARAFAKADPGQAETYTANAKAFARTMDELERWAKKEIARIPRGHRTLTTSHLSFAYFCRDFGFKMIPVQGLSTQDDPKPQYLGEVVDTLRRNHVTAVFPEVGANPKVLQAMVRETGVKVGRPLLADGPSAEYPGYEAMMRYNVSAIVEGLLE